MIVADEIRELQAYGFRAHLLARDGQKMAAGMINDMLERCDEDLSQALAEGPRGYRIR